MAVFGEMLRIARLRAMLTQEELAERAGLSVRAVGKLESGETSRPRPVTVRMLADALGLEEPELTSFTLSAFGIRELRPARDGQQGNDPPAALLGPGSATA